jgi:hypothetical protein
MNNNILSHILFIPVGRLYLKIWYSNNENREKRLKEKYRGDYSDAGIAVLFTISGIIMLIFTLWAVISLLVLLFSQ